MEHFHEGIVLLTQISNKYASSLLSKLTNVFIEMFHYGTCAMLNDDYLKVMVEIYRHRS